ncbi:MAG TPA: TIGR03067 domain-containing protein [Planctomycetota bacterium]|nr:TIGR03067 domain-containing protein [Planctomycetota bacterium]
MNRNLSSRPNLEHLRGQAKKLLADLRSGKKEAALEFQRHLPAAAGHSLEKILGAPYKLADAQSVVARRCDHASWPKLVTYIEQLRALEGTWNFASLKTEGSAIPPAMLVASRIVIDGERFRTISPEAVYDGVFDIDVDTRPFTIDIDFRAGPEAGNSSYGIFRFDDERLVICLGLTGFPRPTEFKTRPGSGHALEVLVHASSDRAIPERANEVAAAGESVDDASFREVTPAIEALQGEWSALRIVIDGKSLPASFLKGGKRVMVGPRTTVTFGPQVILDALTRVDASSEILNVDYLHVGGPTPGAVQRAIARRSADELELCMAAAGAPRPTELRSTRGSGWTLSVWKSGVS